MKKIIWIMWPWNATQIDLQNAYEIGKFSALKWYITLTWWRNEWVMNEWLKWAKEKWGITLWILPNDDTTTFSQYLDIAVPTNMRSGRNYLNVLTSDIVVACWVDHGTSSEISLAIKPWKNIVLIGLYEEANIFFKKLAPNQVYIAKNSSDAISILQDLWY